MNATNTLKKQGSEKTFDYIYKDPALKVLQTTNAQRRAEIGSFLFPPGDAHDRCVALSVAITLSNH